MRSRLVSECVHVLLTFDDEWVYVKVRHPVQVEEIAKTFRGGIKGLIPICCLREPGEDLAFIAAQRISSYGNEATFTALQCVPGIFLDAGVSLRTFSNLALPFIVVCQLS